ncbi:hypothetical protein ACEWY4_014342 [Coilia grayii]|uniref:Rab-GAP TBC domain-containing protein n=1 Tax=Coilia grayii TaxID=363190 RepID=A0ABD1JRZ6_9TELE
MGSSNYSSEITAGETVMQDGVASTHSNLHPQELCSSFPVCDSAQEGVITRDIHRTFPAHDYFKDSNGDGQDSLYKICKAYSVYDEEIGYCQGQSFLAAVLLLHMPEEQAFCVLVKIMYEYGLQALYKNNFEELHCKFYQLERLLQEQLPELWSHFQEMNLEAHMYASQWFLTLFTAKFPLCMVFHITDLLLCEGLNIIFNVALALLKDPYFCACHSFSLLCTLLLLLLFLLLHFPSPLLFASASSIGPISTGSAFLHNYFHLTPLAGRLAASAAERVEQLGIATARAGHWKDEKQKVGCVYL